MVLPTEFLSQPYPLDEETIREFRRTGHAVVRGLCPPEHIGAWREALVEAAMRHNRETRPLEERDVYGKAFLQIMNLWVHEEAVKPFVLSRRFAEVAAKLMGVDAIRLYHDQALFKEPGGGPTPWHQDQFYWPLDTPNTITLWMALVDASPEMGTMEFADGSQEDGFVEIGEQISEFSEAFFEGYVRGRRFPVTKGRHLRAGDATFHYGWTLHRAPGNPTSVTREAMTIIYYADGARVTEPRNSFQENDRNAWLGGLPPGSRADGPLNPVLFP
ncbi:MAG: phytanoyl-CoA dioxygenase family protein [Fimbriimonadales bacterium]|nr:phytanoyl-CoA dioxygenase family protein [Fimbriimonadales bacterium]